MNCHYCGEPLSAFRLRSAGDFCSADHRRKYQRLARNGLARLAEADEALEVVRRKDRPMELVSVVNGSLAPRQFEAPASNLRPGMPRLEGQWTPNLCTSAARWVSWNGVSAGAPFAAALPGWRGRAQARSRLWVLRTVPLEVHAAETAEFLPMLPGRGNCDPALYPPSAAAFPLPTPAAGTLRWADLAPRASFLRHAMPVERAVAPQTAERAFELRTGRQMFPDHAPANAAIRPGAPRMRISQQPAGAPACARAAEVAFRLPPLLPEPLALPGVRPGIAR